MTQDERRDWNQRYSDGSHKWLTPDPFFVNAYQEWVAPAFPQGGRSLDVAGGVGRHALFLAERGWDVTLVDISDIGLDEAEKNAQARGLHLTTVQRDLVGAGLPPGAYDLVIGFFYLERPLFPQLEAALEPDGFLIYKTYTLEQLKLGSGPSHPMHLLKSRELREAFSGLGILHYAETVGDKGVAELVARKR